MNLTSFRWSIQLQRPLQIRDLLSSFYGTDYACHGLNRTLHSAGQIEWYQNKVCDTSMKVGGRQVIKTVDGCCIPINVIRGLPHTQMEPNAAEEFDTLPHVMLFKDKSIKDKFNLQWLRVSVSYYRFTNLREIFQGDLSRKLTVGLTSQDFEPLPCNCRTSGNGNCGYNNMRRNSMVVCKVKCNNTGKVHIGNTQQKFKNRMQQHFNEVQKLVKLDEKSDLHAKHFATQFYDTNLSPTNQRGGTTCSIIWQGNPISVVKTFATKNCALCAKERLEILKQSRSNPQLFINSNNEIYGACRDRPRFHRHVKQITPSTDESINDERASPTHKVTTYFTRCNVCLVDV